MMNKIRLILFTVISVLVLCHQVSIASPESSGINWQNWSPETFKLAKTKNLPVFLFVKADWCHTCQKTNDLTLHNNDVITTINTYYIPIKLDVDADIYILKHQQYRVVNFPTFIILNADYKILDQFSGFMEPEALIQKITPKSGTKIHP